jgi:hypothetical protein
VNFQKHSNRRAAPAPKLSVHASASDVSAIRRPMSAHFVVRDVDGATLCECSDWSDSWERMHSIPGGRSIVDDAGRLLAFIGKVKTDG